MEKIIKEKGTEVYIVREWIKKKEADKLMDDLMEKIDWEQKWNEKFACNEPRLAFSLRDEKDGKGNPIVHNYSGVKTKFDCWDEKSIIGLKNEDIYCQVRGYRDRIEKETYLYHDSCSFQYYRTGDDYVAYHQDKEIQNAISKTEDIKPTKTVICLTLGATRRFLLRRWHPETKERKNMEVFEVYINSGDVLVMEGNCQKTFEHCVPPMKSKKNPVGPRISITFRLLGEY